MRHALRDLALGLLVLAALVGGPARATSEDEPADRGEILLAEADGPDFWTVDGLSRGDTLNIRSGAGTFYPTLAKVPNGTRLRNLGCRGVFSSRWCEVELPRDRIRGWAYGRYLVEGRGDDGGYYDRPDVSERRNGDIEVRWRSGCEMLYDRRGYRVDAGRDCSRTERSRSDELAAQYVRDNPPRNEPKLSVNRDGTIQVRWDSGCRIDYDRRGNRTDADRDCTQRERGRSDEMVARYLRDNPPKNEPKLSVDRDGSIQVRWESGCRISYDRRGNRTDADRSCTQAERSRSDEMVARYVREHGGGRDDAKLAVRKSGEIEVRWDSGCTILYTSRGRLISQGRSCESWQRDRSDDMVAKYLRDHDDNGGGGKPKPPPKYKEYSGGGRITGGAAVAGKLTTDNGKSYDLVLTMLQDNYRCLAKVDKLPPPPATVVLRCTNAKTGSATLKSAGPRRGVNVYLTLPDGVKGDLNLN